MSGRCVWNECVVVTPEPKFSSTNEVGPSTNSSVSPTATDSYKVSVSGESVRFTYADGANHVKMELNRVYSCAEYPYVVFGNSSYDHRLAYAADGYWYEYLTSQPPATTSYYSLRHTNTTANDHNSFNVAYISESDCKAGEVLGMKSSAYSTHLPENGIKFGKWYTYLGTDSIDPTAISINGAPRAGETLTVTVTPSGSKVYGGTVSYLYQYRINGGDWVDIQTATATSISFTVPDSAKTVQFRARAKDDIGFTSSDYVTSASAVVEQMKLWVGVNGTARKGTDLYVGVNGKARKVTAGYIGVNGKARRFL